ncbi:hypothetical protein A3K73_05920 [Candidatus Pacearchaeota archaeon RBG_13_36_9]|nr:MAG: hypothetical protein A3K73_05920 [Candidatus Pacearchaeota archaeon RBG_13_36_9]
MDSRRSLVIQFSQNAKFESNESIAGIFRKQLKSITRPDKLPDKYFFLKSLCNPTEAYYSYINPDIEKTKELSIKLEWGKQLHKLSVFWFELLPSFRIHEGKIDGIHVGVPGVRGSVDYFIGDSIFELKTKYRLPENEEEIFAYFIQDLEQLAFYAIVHPENPKTNYLVFLKDSPPYNLKAFKVVIKDLGKIKSLLITRINSLKEAILKKDPSKLEKCRYYNRNCIYQQRNICNCENLNPISNDLIKKSVELTFDEEMTKALEDTQKNRSLPKDLYSVYNVLAPRKYLGVKKEQIEKFEPEEGENKKEIYESIMWRLILELKFNLNYLLKPEFKNLLVEPRLIIPFRWTNLKSSADLEGEKIPYIFKVSNSMDTRKPNEYYLAELGVICSVYNKKAGLIIIIYPELNDFIQVFEVKYNNIEQISKDVKELINLLEKEDVNYLDLPPCIGFMNDKKTCPLMDTCNSGGGAGCCPGHVPK